MNDFWLNSIAEITTLSPIHIGTGEKLNALDCVVKDSHLYLIDEFKLMDWSGENEKRSETYVKAVEEGKSLKDFFEQQGVDVNRFASRCVPINTRERVKDVMPFMCTPSGKTYIPGSSFKGSLRSAMLRGVLLTDEDVFSDVDDIVEDCAQLSKKRKQASENAQARVFVKRNVKPSQYSNYDINRTLMVRDTEVLQADCTEVLSVGILSLQIDDSLTFKQRNETKVLNFVEAIRPETILQIPINRDIRLLTDSGPGAEELQFFTNELRTPLVWLTNVCRHASCDLIKQEFLFYRDHNKVELAKWFADKLMKLRDDPTIFILPLGWGSGYDAKTITDMLTDETIEKVFAQEPDPYRPGKMRAVYPNIKGLGRPQNRPENPWLGINDTPKSRKVVIQPDGTLIPMGWVMVRLVDEPSPALSDWKKIQDSTPCPEQIAVESQMNGVTPNLPDNAAPEIIEQFDRQPQIGECFYGQVFDQNSKLIYMEIPGLSADDVEACMDRSQFPGDIPDRILCEVIEITTDPDSSWLPMIRCKPL